MPDDAFNLALALYWPAFQLVAAVLAFVAFEQRATRMLLASGFLLSLLSGVGRHVFFRLIFSADLTDSVGLVMVGFSAVDLAATILLLVGLLLLPARRLRAAAVSGGS